MSNLIIKNCGGGQLNFKLVKDNLFGEILKLKNKLIEEHEYSDGDFWIGTIDLLNKSKDEIIKEFPQ